MVATMISRNMVEVIDHSKIPNLSNIDPDPNFTDPAFNPGLKYGVPYMWGTIGIRSEEHTSELQSLMRISYAVFCLKKKNKTQNTCIIHKTSHSNHSKQH